MSTPAPPSSTSAPPRPTSESLPAPPVSVFTPSLPVSTSSPAEPITFSMFARVSMSVPSVAVPAISDTVTWSRLLNAAVSMPARPSSVSAPPRPSRMLLPLLPVMRLLSSLPVPFRSALPVASVRFSTKAPST